MKHKKLAEQAGFHIASSNLSDIGWIWCSDGYPIDEKLEHFAELVRADEREACAKLCEKLSKSTWTFCNFAEAIRAKGDE